MEIKMQVKICVTCKKEPIRKIINNSNLFEINLRELCQECFDIRIDEINEKYHKLRAKSLGE